jgi:hypothetical protein
MLLSVFVSFLLARRFHGKLYAFLITVTLVIMSFFSTGSPTCFLCEFPSWSRFTLYTRNNGVLLKHLLPLSFPFHASINRQHPNLRTLNETYQLHFLTSTFQESPVFVSVGPGIVDTVYLTLYFTWTHYVLYYSFFLLVNVIGAIIGYWTEKRAFIDKVLQKVKPLVVNTRVGRAVVGSAEKWATVCGWIAFGLILAGILLPWGTYSSAGTSFQNGLTSTSHSYLIVGSIATLTGLLLSLRKPYSVSNVFLGGGGLVTIIGAVRWISFYYGPPPLDHPIIFALSVGPFVTLVGGACAMLAAVLYALHARTQAASEDKQLA